MFAPALPVAEHDESLAGELAHEQIKMPRDLGEVGAGFVARLADEAVEGVLWQHVGTEVDALCGGGVHFVTPGVADHADADCFGFGGEFFAGLRPVPRCPRDLCDAFRRDLPEEIVKTFAARRPFARPRECHNPAFKLLQAVRRRINRLAVVDVQFAAALDPIATDDPRESLPQTRHLVVDRYPNVEGAAADHERPENRPVPRLVDARKDHRSSVTPRAIEVPPPRLT